MIKGFTGCGNITCFPAQDYSVRASSIFGGLFYPIINTLEKEKFYEKHDKEI